MMNRLIDIEKEDLSLLLLNNPVFSEINDTTTVDEHKHLDLIVYFCFLNTRAQFTISGHRVDFILYVLAFEHFLDR